MLKDKGSRVLRTPPGYMRHQTDPADYEGGGKLNTDPRPLIKEQSLDYINTNNTQNKPYLAKHFELKNRFDSIYLSKGLRDNRLNNSQNISQLRQLASTEDTRIV